jgi:hypothetical protein
MAVQTPNGGSIVAEPPSCNSALRFEHDGASGPGIQFNWVPDAEAALMSSSCSQVVETRRLELLTLSLQRRCSAN